MEKYNFLSLYLAVSFLSQLCETESFADQLTKAEKDFGVDKDALLKEKNIPLNLLMRMTEDFKAEYKNELDQISFYFGKTQDGKQHEELAWLVLLISTDELLTFKSAKDLKDFLTELPTDEYNRRFFNVLQDYDNTALKGTAKSEALAAPAQTLDAVAITRYILKMDLPDALLYRLEEIYFNREAHIEKLCFIINEAVSFMNKYRDELEPVINGFYDYWGRMQGDRSFYQFVTEDIRFLSGMEEYKGGYMLVPSLHFAEFSMSIPADSDKRKAVLSISLMYGDTLSVNAMFGIASPKLSTERAINALKLLSDKSRFEIMRYIHSHNAYGNEIAEHLGLTTATVSHHMSALLEANLISLEQKNGKIYYHINKDTLSQYINFYEEKLL
mgnify:FL=1